MLDGLFSGAGRDFESLGLGWLTLASDTLAPDGAEGDAVGHVRAALRALADQRRFFGNREPRETPTPRLKALWQRVHERGGPEPEELRKAVADRAGDAVIDYVIDPDKVCIRLSTGLAWVCESCRRQHLSRAAGYCTRCARPLPEGAHDRAGGNGLLRVEGAYRRWTLPDDLRRAHRARPTG